MQQMGGSSGDSRQQMECKGLFGGGKTQLQPVTRMPDEQDPAILEARRKKQGEMMARGGRDSTILSDSLSGTGGKL